MDDHTIRATVELVNPALGALFGSAYRGRIPLFGNQPADFAQLIQGGYAIDTAQHIGNGGVGPEFLPYGMIPAVDVEQELANIRRRQCV